MRRDASAILQTGSVAVRAIKRVTGLHLLEEEQCQTGETDANVHSQEGRWLISCLTVTTEVCEAAILFWKHPLMYLMTKHEFGNYTCCQYVKFRIVAIFLEKHPHISSECEANVWIPKERYCIPVKAMKLKNWYDSAVFRGVCLADCDDHECEPNTKRVQVSPVLYWIVVMYSFRLVSPTNGTRTED